MYKYFNLQNHSKATPSFLKNGKNRISIWKIIKHLMDEKATDYTIIDRLLEQIIILYRLSGSADFKFKPQYKPPHTESKRGTSNLYGRAISKAFLDQYCKIGYFDDFDSYFRKSKKTKKYVNTFDQVYTKKKSTTIAGPDFIAKDSSGEFVIVESKGRLEKYSESDLKRFIKQCNNGEIKDVTNNKSFRCKYWTVPIHISYSDHCSEFSMVDPPSDGLSARELSIDVVERAHYSKVLQNLNEYEIASHLLNENEYEFTQAEVTVAKNQVDNKDYVLNIHPLVLPVFILDEIGFQQRTYALDLEIFKAILSSIRNDGNLLEISSIANEYTGNNNYRCYDGSGIFSLRQFSNFREKTI